MTESSSKGDPENWSLSIDGNKIKINWFDSSDEDRKKLYDSRARNRKKKNLELGSEKKIIIPNDFRAMNKKSYIIWLPVLTVRIAPRVLEEGKQQISKLISIILYKSL